MEGLQRIKSPAALATFGAFFVPEPLGTFLVLMAATWWVCRKLYRDDGDATLFPEVTDRNLSFYIFRTMQRPATSVVLPLCSASYPHLTAPSISAHQTSRQDSSTVNDISAKGQQLPFAQEIHR